MAEIIIPLIPVFIWLIGLACVPDEEYEELMRAIDRHNAQRRREGKCRRGRGGR